MCVFYHQYPSGIVGEVTYFARGHRWLGPWLGIGMGYEVIWIDVLLRIVQSQSE